ncbi:MAG: hypothetical protein IH855_03430 [Bacteroidetes bacterium]|nr:hypothetical protein [Bacteroidota bacterium]
MADHSGHNEVVDAIHDLTRVIISLSGKYQNRSEAIRSLNELSIPSSRIASIFAMETSDVSSVLAKARKKNDGKG